MTRDLPDLVDWTCWTHKHTFNTVTARVRALRALLRRFGRRVRLGLLVTTRVYDPWEQLLRGRILVVASIRGICFAGITLGL